MCGYKKFKFTLFTGQKVSFWAKSKGEAIQKALNMEQHIRKNLIQSRAMALKNKIHNLGESASIPDELLRDVISDCSTTSTPDRPASIAG